MIAPRIAGVSDGNIVLTGFMGTGKSTVGRALAQILGRSHVDTDELIHQRHGRIQDIFASEGEEAFRRMEVEVAAEVAAATGQVISTGGRMLLDRDNVVALSSSGRVWCLTAEPSEILRRVVGVPGRPLLAGHDPAQAVLDLLAERAPAYRRFPGVATDGRSPQDIAVELAGLAADRPDSATDRPGQPGLWVGAAVLPLVRHLLGGTPSVISDAGGIRDHVPSLGRLPAPVLLDDSAAATRPAIVLGGAGTIGSLGVRSTVTVWCPTSLDAIGAAMAMAVAGRDWVVVELATVQGDGDLAAARVAVMGRVAGDRRRGPAGARAGSPTTIVPL